MKKRVDVINHYIKKYKFKTYLECGVNDHVTFNNVKIEQKECVDFSKASHATYTMTTDLFFESVNKSYDIIFIDADHRCEFVDRDIKNALQHLNPGGVIIMHDCHPIDEYCQRDVFSDDYAWAGTVWKAYVKNRAELPYEMYVWDNDWGCGVIDTNIKKISDTSVLPTDMNTMTYQDFLNHPEWMNFKESFN